ncbi:MAG: (2Fe-2S)-binding protein [Sulfurovum sp.]
MTKEEIKELDNDCEVCVCMNLSLGEIKTAIEEGNNTIEALMDSTEAGTVCELCQSVAIDEDEDREIHLDEILDSMKS